jgi:hypothetical protein
VRGRPTERFGLALLACLLAASCASRGQRVFGAAAQEDARLALEAWTRAVARADALGAARLLYEGRVSQGPFRISGTLAVRAEANTIEATLTGPFGSPLAQYSGGALRGEGLRPVVIPPLQMRWLLAGVWEADAPSVEGIDAGDALLRWRGAEQVEGVLDVAAARFKSLEVSRGQGKILATYAGAAAPWPERIEIEDTASGGKLRLTLVAVE